MAARLFQSCATQGEMRKVTPGNTGRRTRMRTPSRPRRAGHSRLTGCWEPTATRWPAAVGFCPRFSQKPSQLPARPSRGVQLAPSGHLRVRSYLTAAASRPEEPWLSLCKGSQSGPGPPSLLGPARPGPAPQNLAACFRAVVAAVQSVTVLAQEHSPV